MRGETQIARESHEAAAISLNEKFEKSENYIEVHSLKREGGGGEREGGRKGDKREEQKKEGKE